MRQPSPGFKPRRRWGQNFLVNSGATDGIIAAFAPRPDDLVLEIGPGDGALTRRLAGRVRRLVALEIDPDLAAPLREGLASPGPDSGVAIVLGDALRADLGALLASMGAGPDRPARLIGNLPYSIATAVILKVILARLPVRDLLVMVQREVAERILSLPGRKSYGGLSVLCQIYARAEPVLRLRPGSFRPRPKVDSAVIRLTPRDPGGSAAQDPGGFSALVGAAFAHRRKTLLNNLARMPRQAADASGAYRGDALGAQGSRDLIRRAGLDPSQRAEAIALQGFLALFEAWSERGL